MRQLVNYRIFGKSTNPTIYYLTGYNTRISLYRIHIWLLVSKGFRVVAFEYQKAVLADGQPRYLIECLHKLERIITMDMTENTLAGVLGISLGSWFGLNLLQLCGIEKGFFLTGGVGAIDTIWKQKPLEKEKKTFIRKGYTEEKLRLMWSAFDYTPNGKRFADKKFVLISSVHDEVLNYNDVILNVTGWKKDNKNITHIIYKRLNHTLVIVRGLFKLSFVASFFKS